MPESKTVLKLSQAYGAKLDSAFTIKLADFKTRFDDYNTKEKSMGELEKKTVQQELTALDKDIQEYKKNGATLMKLKYDELMRPLYNKLNKTIAQVAKENNFTQILTLTGNEFAYIDTNLDITDLVLKN
jgi:Outer membrane protein (OmpH-like).